MEDFLYPGRADLVLEAEEIKSVCTQKNSGFSFVRSIFGNPDPHDKTTVFDYVDEEWIDIIHGQIKSVAENSWFNGDGSVEHKIAYICVDINTAHRFGNGNKRSSLLVLLILIRYNNLWDRIAGENADTLYKVSKKIAKEGGDWRDENITTLRECLKTGDFTPYVADGIGSEEE